MGSRGAYTACVLGLTLVVTAVLAGPSVAERVQHPRDPDAFQTYVGTYVDGWSSSSDLNGPARDKAWVLAHPDVVLAEGEQACAWLAMQPEAPRVDPSRQYDFDRLMHRYVKTSAATTQVELSRMGRRTVVAGAWGYLCHSARESATTPAVGD